MCLLFYFAALAAVPQSTSSSSSKQSEVAPVNIAMDAAKILWPRIKRDELVEKSLDTTISQTFAAQNIFRQINARYPKADAAAKSALRPLFLQNAEKRVDEHLNEVTEFYRGNFTDDELREIVEFWQSAVGAKILQNTTSGTEFDVLVQKMGNSSAIGKQTGVNGEMTAQARHVADSAVAALSDAEVEEYLAFAQSKAGRKYRLLAPQRIALQLQWANRRSPEFEKEVTKVLIRAINAHIDTFPKRVGEMHIRLTEPA
jgi:Uncharacterized protein conserved in bacteria (DUF2059)